MNKTPKVKGLIQVTIERLRVRHYSHYTEKHYVGWIRRYIRFHAPQHPREVGPDGIGIFLTHLAIDGKVAPATQNQALNALVLSKD